MSSEQTSRTASVEMKQFADALQEKFKKIKKENPEISGFYVCGMFTYGRDAHKTDVDILNFGDNVSPAIVANYLMKQIDIFTKQTQMENAMQKMERIVKHKEPEMRFVQTAYEQLEGGNKYGIVTRNMVLDIIHKMPLTSMNNWSDEQLAPFIDKLDLTSEVEALDSVLKDFQDNVKEKVGDGLTSKLVIQSIGMIAEGLKRSMCLEAPVEQIAHKLAMAIDVKAEGLK